MKSWREYNSEFYLMTNHTKWTRKIDLLQKDFILIPVNENEHWNMIILCYPQKLYSKG